MKFCLKELFGGDETYLMGIAFETYTNDDDQNMKVKRKGWEIPYIEVDTHEIDAYATKYDIPGRRIGDGRKNWESDMPFKDEMTGDETYYIMHVRHIDGSSISKDEFHDINEKIADESGEDWGNIRTSWATTGPRRPLMEETSLMELDEGLQIIWDILEENGLQARLNIINGIWIFDPSHDLPIGTILKRGDVYKLIFVSDDKPNEPIMSKDPIELAQMVIGFISSLGQE